MRPLESLTYEAVVGLLTANFTRMADGRDPQRLRYGLRDTLLSGYARAGSQAGGGTRRPGGEKAASSISSQLSKAGGRQLHFKLNQDR